MKLIFSLLLFTSLKTLASSPLVLITYEGMDNESLLEINKVMSKTFKISKNLYRIEQGKCEKKESIATHICIDDALNVKVISRNNEVMTEMLGVYWK